MNKVLIVLTVLQFWLFGGNAQNCAIDLKTLPIYGNNFSSLNDSFEKSTECTVVLSEGFDTINYKNIINKITYWFLNKKTKINFQTSTGIHKINDGSKYLLIGILDDFENMDIYNLPFDLKNSNTSNDKILGNKNDAIVSINGDANCLALIGNSYEALVNLASRWLGYYDYYVLKDNKIRFFGNLRNGAFSPDSLIDVELIREKNYTQILENDYVILHFSCRYDSISKYRESIDSLKILFEDFCSMYKLKMPDNKFNCYIHYNQLEINLVSGTPRPGNMGGFVIDNLVHTVGMDINLLMHESIHYIFGYSLKSPNTFFNEGIPESYLLFLNSGKIAQDCKLVTNYLNFDLEGLILGELDFVRGPYVHETLLSYPLCGLFVKYLIDKYTIDKVKEFYKYADIKQGFKIIFNSDLENIISEWKDWIIKNAN